ncbi:MAG: hypothetical protein ACRDMH_11140 [Solirubrobacterales bacterium]
MRPSAVEWWGLVALVILAVVTLLILERGETLKGDELGYAVRVSPLGDGLFVPPAGKYVIPLPLLVYRGLFATAGLGSYLPYELVGSGFVALNGVLVFLLARRRIGAMALAPTAIVLFFGTASEVTAAGTLRLPELMSMAAGLGMLLALERRTLTGDVLGALLLAASLFSHPTGLAFGAAGAVLVLMRPSPHRWRSAWVVLAPACAWAIVWLAVRPSGGPGSASLDQVPGFTLHSLIAVTSAITGATRYVHAIPSQNHIGWALAILLVTGCAAALWARLKNHRPPPTTFWAALVALVVLWAVTALAPGGTRGAEASRYMYPGGVLLLLVLVELAAGVRLPAWAILAAACVAAVSLVLNADQLRSAAATWRSWSDYIRAEETSLDLAKGKASLGFVPEDPAAQPYVGDHRMILGALPYYVISDRWGSPAYPPDELLRRPPAVRWAADAVLARALSLKLGAAGPKPKSDAQPPSVSAIAHGRATRDGNCTTLRPAGSQLTADLIVPSAGLWISGLGAGASPALHRFGPLAAYPLGSASAGRPASLVIPPDSAPVPWRLQVSARRPVTACSR